MRLQPYIATFSNEWKGPAYKKGRTHSFYNTGRLEPIPIWISGADRIREQICLGCEIKDVSGMRGNTSCGHFKRK